MRTRSYQHGEYIPICWEDSAEFHAVKGHVNLQEFNRAREQWNGEPHQHTEIEQIYGRWSMQMTENGPGLTLDVYLLPGMGRFPVTVMWRNDMARRCCLSLKPGPTRRREMAGG